MTDIPKDPEQQEEFAAGLHRIDEAGKLDDDKAEIAADDAGASALASKMTQLPPD